MNDLKETASYRDVRRFVAEVIDNAGCIKECPVHDVPIWKNGDVESLVEEAIQQENCPEGFANAALLRPFFKDYLQDFGIECGYCAFH